MQAGRHVTLYLLIGDRTRPLDLHAGRAVRLGSLLLPLILISSSSREIAWEFKKLENE
jgi:hypothetical protein